MQRYCIIVVPFTVESLINDAGICNNYFLLVGRAFRIKTGIIGAMMVSSIMTTNFSMGANVISPCESPCISRASIIAAADRVYVRFPAVKSFNMICSFIVLLPQQQ